MAIGQAKLVYVKHALAAPGADTNMVTAFTPGASTNYLEVQISLATASILDLRVTDGTTAYSIALNNGVALNASQLYRFDVLCAHVAGSTTLTYSLRVRTNGVIQNLVIREVVGA